MDWLLSNNSLLAPQLSATAQVVFRSGYGLLLLGVLLLALPNWRRFFTSERWGGYAKSTPSVDCLQNPISTSLIATVWFACAIALIAGFHPLIAASINLLFCRYFFVHMRWKGVLRGMGAPGLMTYWTGFAVFLLTLTQEYAPKAQSLALLTIQVDFAFIMLSAGLYKMTAGYARNYGMEYGLVNPQWGFYPDFWKRFPPSSVVFKTMNHLAWLTEVVSALLMLVPATRFIGGSLMLMSFIFIATQIRLSLLAEIIILDCFVFFHPGSLGDRVLNQLTSAVAITPTVSHNVPFLTEILTVCLGLYLFLLPIAHGLLFINFYGKKSLPGKAQEIFERYTNFFGLIIWRVFSVDIVNFFIRIYRVERTSTERQLISNYSWLGGLRFSHVGEAICITSLFTTLKYYANQPELFRERLFRYARTLNNKNALDLFLFEYVSVQKRPKDFSYVPVAEYLVDTESGALEVTYLDESVSVNAAHECSPVREGVRPGSYVALGK